MKRSKQCPKCASLRIGYLAEQADASDAMGNDPAFVRRDEIQVRALGHSADATNTGMWNHGYVRHLLGQLEAYVCAECGYHETYVKDPQSVPWDKIRSFRWVNDEPASDGPFR